MSINPEKFPPQKQPLIDAIIRCVNVTRFAKSIGVSRQVVSGWLYNRQYAPPPQYCKIIEEVTMGHVTREQLRPDIFGKADEESLSDKQKITACISILESVKETLGNKKNKGVK
jgi:DNA-binding transcriptional regulator YdaS (Cro superfamily)